MTAVATLPAITPEDMLRLPDEKDFELVDGSLVAKRMGTLSSWIGGELFFHIRTFLETLPLGWLFTADNGFYCFADRPNTLRRPDISFVRHGRLPGDILPEGYIRIAPDLVVEVISPNDRASEVNVKVLDFLSAGVPLIWVVDPEARVVYIHRADGTLAMVREHDELSGESVLPGFRRTVSAIFPKPSPAAAETLPTP